MNDTYLFVGGVKDGERHYGDGRPIIIVAVHSQADGSLVSFPRCKIHQYNLTRSPAAKGKPCRYVYLLHGLTS